MIAKEVIDELKKSHPAAFAEKMAVLKDEQVVASVLMQQIEHDKEHPPEESALNQVRNAAGVLQVHAERVDLARAQYDKVRAEVRARFPDLDLSGIEIVLVSAGPDGEVTTKMIAELREQLRLGSLECVDLRYELSREKEGNQKLQGTADAWAQQIKDLQDALRAEKEAGEKLRADLSAAQELLKNIGACGNIKEVRELLKPAETQPIATPSQTVS